MGADVSDQASLLFSAPLGEMDRHHKQSSMSQHLNLLKDRDEVSARLSADEAHISHRFFIKIYEKKQAASPTETK